MRCGTESNDSAKAKFVLSWNWAGSCGFRALRPSARRSAQWTVVVQSPSDKLPPIGLETLPGDALSSYRAADQHLVPSRRVEDRNRTRREIG